MKKLAFAAFALTLISFASPTFAADKGNLNLVSLEEITQVQGLSTEAADAIVMYRQDMGDFLSFDDLADVDGLTPEMITIIQNNFVIEGIEDIDCGC